MIVKYLIKEYEEASITEAMLEINRASYVLERWGEKTLRDISDVLIYTMDNQTTGIVEEFKNNLRNIKESFRKGGIKINITKKKILGGVLEHLRRKGIPIYMTKKDATKDGFD